MTLARTDSPNQSPWGNGLQHTRLVGAIQSPGVGGDQHIRGRVAPLGLEAGEQGVALAGHQVDLYTGFRGILVQQGLDQRFLASGIDVEFSGRGRQGSAGQNRQDHGEEAVEESTAAQ
jgi:hypothetical protein